MKTNDGVIAWDKLLSELFSSRDQHKLEWTIGSVLADAGPGKILAIYGKGATGKSTILNIVKKIIDEYSVPAIYGEVHIQHDGVFYDVYRGGTWFVATNSLSSNVDPEHDSRVILTRTTGRQLDSEEFSALLSRIYSAIEVIAQHCYQKYLAFGPSYYDSVER